MHHGMQLYCIHALKQLLDGAGKHTWQVKPMLGLATPRIALTAAWVLSKVLFCFHIRYAMANDALLDTPWEQCRSTLPSFSFAAWKEMRNYTSSLGIRHQKVH